MSRVPAFPAAGSAAVYLVIPSFPAGWLVGGRDCCAGRDTWQLTSINLGIPVFSSSTTTPEAEPPPLSCTPPATGYSGPLVAFSLLSLVIVQPEATPNTFPTDMFLRFCFGPGLPFLPGNVFQIVGSTPCPALATPTLRGAASKAPDAEPGVVDTLPADADVVDQLEALEPLQAASDVDALLRLVGSAPDPLVRTGALISLATIPDSRVVPTAVQAAGDPHPWVRLSAVATLAYRGGNEGLAILQDASKDADPLVRAMARRALEGRQR